MNKLKLVLAVGIGVLISCATPHSDLGNDVVERYRSVWESHADLEDEFLFVMFNLERMPNDPFLKKEYQRLKTALSLKQEEVLLVEREKHEIFVQWDNRIIDKRIELKNEEEKESDAEKRIKEQKQKIKEQLQFME
jgi:hypothetical protein